MASLPVMTAAAGTPAAAAALAAQAGRDCDLNAPAAVLERIAALNLPLVRLRADGRAAAGTLDRFERAVLGSAPFVAAAARAWALLAADPGEPVEVWPGLRLVALERRRPRRSAAGAAVDPALSVLAAVLIAPEFLESDRLRLACDAGPQGPPGDRGDGGPGPAGACRRGTAACQGAGLEHGRRRRAGAGRGGGQGADHAAREQLRGADAALARERGDAGGPAGRADARAGAGRAAAGGGAQLDGAAPGGRAAAGHAQRPHAHRRAARGGHGRHRRTGPRPAGGLRRPRGPAGARRLRRPLSRLLDGAADRAAAGGAAVAGRALRRRQAGRRADRLEGGQALRLARVAARDVPGQRDALRGRARHVPRGSARADVGDRREGPVHPRPLRAGRGDEPHPRRGRGVRRRHLRAGVPVWPGARRGQDRRARGGAVQARAAGRRGVRADQAAPQDRGEHPAGHPADARPDPRRAAPPRAVRRSRLPGQAGRRRDPAVRPDHRRGRRVRCDELQPHLPQRHAAGEGPRRDRKVAPARSSTRRSPRSSPGSTSPPTSR